LVRAADSAPRGVDGVILAQAGRFGGWSLYFTDGKPVYAHNWIGRERYKIVSSEPVMSGKATVRVEFACDGAGLFSADEGADVGQGEGTPVSDDYAEGAHNNRFTGRIHKVTIELATTKVGGADEALLSK
jgi:arylsulfatase